MREPQKRTFSLRWKLLSVFTPIILIVFGFIGWRVSVHLSHLGDDAARFTALYELTLLASAGALLLILTLMLISWPPLMRLKRQANLLPLLGQKQFLKVRERLNQNSRWRLFNDEIDILDSSAINLSLQLETLEKAVDVHTSEIERVSLFDALTGLANRNLFQYETERELKHHQDSGTLAAVLLFDLDNFKRFNDSLGHQQGDKLLSTISQRLKHNSKALGAVARLGGDEFAILTKPLKRASQAEQLGQKLLQLVQKPITLGSSVHVISCSIGIALFDGNQSPSNMLRNAEIAMYKAKDQGGNCCKSFDNPMAAEIHHNLSLEEDIRRGFQESEFVLYLQPKVNMNEKTEGFEALIRWDHVDRGIIPPGEFIPAMEAMGFIIEMDRLVLDASCRHLKTWKNLHPDISIAVNISSNHLTSPEFLNYLTECLNKYDINPERLELEIIESMLMENVSAALDILHRIKDLGVRIAIDDFGTGYSSFSYLKTLPIDTLKIDREFIKDIPDSEKDMQISSVIIYLAKQLGFKVVAEGVETLEQFMFLKTNQCDLAQGFYFSKPIPAHKAVLMLEYERSQASSAGKSRPNQAEAFKFIDQ